jgi:hypothetical protein
VFWQEVKKRIKQQPPAFFQKIRDIGYSLISVGSAILIKNMETPNFKELFFASGMIGTGVGMVITGTLPNPNN